MKVFQFYILCDISEYHWTLPSRPACVPSSIEIQFIQTCEENFWGGYKLSFKAFKNSLSHAAIFGWLFTRLQSRAVFNKIWGAQWVVPEKIHTPPTEEISAVRRGRGDKIVSDNSKCIRTSEGGRGVNFQFPPWRWYGCFLE